MISSYLSWWKPNWVLVCPYFYQEVVVVFLQPTVVLLLRQAPSLARFVYCIFLESASIISGFNSSDYLRCYMNYFRMTWNQYDININLKVWYKSKLTKTSFYFHEDELKYTYNLSNKYHKYWKIILKFSTMTCWGEASKNKHLYLGFWPKGPIRLTVLFKNS